ncbi:MAG TPA: type IV toxin-antitoxin system AbiEi family antitoxin domain-containing protein [Myxococcaceae bacterium]|nr:type IV toxin-antitoxin system AbiEi family antitoxin domain-containing protein [Myxococcaceae bacterium]
MGTGDRACAAIAEKQFGLISRDQAIRTGMSERAIGRRLGAGRWRQVLPGVYRLAGAPASCERSLKAATLWGGEGCVVSHRAAAALHGLAGFARQGVEVQSSRRLQRSDVIAHRTCFTSSLYPVSIKGIPTTSVTRTLIDLAGTVTREALEEALDDALRRGLTDLGRLRGVLSRSGSTRRGARVLRQLIAARDGRREKTDSQLEDQLLRLLRSRGLPPPAIHLDVSHGDERICEVDMAYPNERVAIEVHGYRFHSARSAWERDQRRENELVRAGWRVLKATSSQLDRDPDSFIDTLRALLKSGRRKRGDLPVQSDRGSRRRCFHLRKRE